jgi:nitrogen-specific signal transduction histidine kinase
MTIKNQSAVVPNELKMFETLPGFFLIFSRELIILNVSNDYLIVCGKSRSEMIGAFLYDVFPPDLDRPFLGSINFSITSVLNSAQAHHLPVIKVSNTLFKNELNVPEGYWLSAHHPVLDEDGTISYIIHSTRDLTRETSTAAQFQDTIEKLNQDRLKNEKEMIELNDSLSLANEEIQAYNEELHSANDELSTLNHHLFQSQRNLEDLNDQLIKQVEFSSEEAIKAHIDSDNQRAKLNRFFMQAPAGICELRGSDFVFELINPSYQQLFPGRELLGKTLLQGVPELEGQPILNIIRDVYQTGKTFEGKELLIPLKNEEAGVFEDRYFNFIYQASYDASGGIDGVIVFVNEVTDLVIMLTNQKINEQKKDEFLSIASHELKTPLTSIRAYNQLLKRTKDASLANNFIEKSSYSISRMEQLVNDLLDVTKINAGKLVFDMQEFNFREMLEESIESIQLTKPSHQIKIQSNCDVKYTGDRFRLEQVILNFLTNAIKYSPGKDSVLVNCEVNFNNVIVSVQDFGIGIEASDLSRLFERYYRVNNDDMRFEGLGLGLYISSEILKRHQGSFWIESEPGQGSTFYFRLPLENENKSTPIKELDQYFEDPTIKIELNPDRNCLNVDWIGFQSLETVKHGCLKILDLLEKNSVYKVVNDNTHVLGTWSEAAEWVGIDWFPMMEKAGLKYFAWVYSPSAFSLLSAQKSIDVAVGGITTQFFTDTVSAQAWIVNK